MNHHLEAWEHVKKHLFGTVCEVTTKTPWGFKEDRADIINKSVDEFLEEDTRYDTVILHILSGEGETKERILDVLDKAYKNAVKVVVLEHFPEEFGLKDLDFIENYLIKEYYEYENWGRNLLYAFTTMSPLCLPKLSDEYLKEHINKTYVNETDHGVCKNNLIYTHTSETPIDFKLPEGEYIWVIGGGIPFESMGNDTLIDPVLRQCIDAARTCNVTDWKLERLYSFKEIDEDKDKWLNHWRKAEIKHTKPKYILHKDLRDVKEKGKVIYVSTVDKSCWNHLIKDNIILDAWTPPRDKVKIYEN